MTMLTPIDDCKDWPEGSYATFEGRVGTVHHVWKSESGNLVLDLHGPKFDHDGEMLAAELVTPGGTPDLYEKTDLTLNEISYELRNLAEPDGHVPAGWAVFYKADAVYVAWGLEDEKQAQMLAVGHELGMRFVGSKF